MPPSATATQHRSRSLLSALSLGRAGLAPRAAAAAASHGSMQDAELSSGALSGQASAPEQDDSSQDSALAGVGELPGRMGPAIQQEQVSSSDPSAPLHPAQIQADDRPPGLLLRDAESEPAQPVLTVADYQHDKEPSYIMLTEAWHAHKPASETRAWIPHIRVREAQTTTAGADPEDRTHADEQSLASTDSEAEQEVLTSVLMRLRNESQSRAALSAQAVAAEQQATELNPTRTQGAHAAIASHSRKGESSPCLT